jgi:hypothetical protein
MDELIPVLIAFCLGSLVWRTSKGTVLVALSTASILATAFVASWFSGEFSRSYLYLPIDLIESGAGLAAAATLWSLLSRRRASSCLVNYGRLFH